MFGTFFKIFDFVVRKVNEEFKKDETTTNPSDKNDGVFDVVDTPNTDEFQPSITPTETPSVAPTIEPEATQPVVTEPQGPVYDKDGYDENGFDKDGFDRDGYDENGFNKDGFDRDGYKQNGLDKDGYDREGYNVIGFDREGYNKEGFDINGYNKEGFDKEGYDKEGFDKEGYDKEGFNKEGYNKEGLNRDGFDKDGWKIETKETKDENGNLSSKTITKTNLNGEKIVETIKYSSDGKITSSVVQTYSADGVILSKVSEQYNSDGSLKSSTTTKYTKEGLPEVAHTYNPSTGAIKTTRYDENGNKINAKAIDSVSGSISKTIGVWRFKKTLTMNAEDIYNAITNLDSNTKFYLSGKEVIDTVAGDERSSECLRIADKDTIATNSGKNLTLKWGSKSQTLTDVNVLKADDEKLSKYSDYLSDVIDDSIGHMGYDAQKTDVYKYGPNSQMSKDIANSSTFKDFVNKNKAAIAKGVTTDNPLTFAFNSGDLYYSLASVRIIDSWVDSNGKTHLILEDIYDFNKNCKGDSAGAVLNRVGAAAQEDGELKAYALLMEVVI